MRFLCLILALLMLLFAAVQLNDPDSMLWAVIYALPALWALLAAWRPAVLQEKPVAIALLGFLVFAAALTFYYWPKTPQWWRQEVWWEVETAP